MSQVEQLITDNIDVWTSAIKKRESQGRGSSKKIELYGIKKLRELILDLAVRGLLVPQDPKDESATILLEKIEAEKEHLIKEGKLKKQKKLPPIAEEEKPFQLPQKWVWTRLDSISDINGGFAFKSSKYVEEGTRVIRISDFDEKGFKNDKIVRYEYSTDLDPYLLAEKNILMAMTGGTVGKSLLVSRLDEGMVVNQRVATIRLISDILPSFVHIALQTAIVQNVISEAKNSTNDNISMSDIKGFFIALPPENQVPLIVAKVDELMVLCDQLEQQTEDSLSAHQTLVETLLNALLDAAQSRDDRSSKESAFDHAWQRIAEHFDVLFTTEQSIDQLKQTILQLAVMGKLVPQDRNDEPASALFARLETERGSFLTERSSDDNEAKTMLRKLKKLDSPKEPFPLPDSWSCIHLIQLCSSLVDCHNKTAPYVESGIPIIRTTNIRERQFVARDLKYVNQETYDYWSRRCPPKPGDIMFTREAPMGEALIIPEEEKWCLGQRTMLIRVMHEFVSNEYLLLALTEPHLLERASEHAVGLTVKHLRVGDVENLNVPLPPLNEQKRIVEKVNALMSLCDSLKSGIRESQTSQLHLADAMAESALEKNI